MSTLDELLDRQTLTIKQAIEDIMEQAGTSDADWAVLLEAGTMIAVLRNKLESCESKINVFNHRLAGYLEAYPEDIFTEPSKAEWLMIHAKLGELGRGTCDRLHGSWGRRIAKSIKKVLE